MSLNVHVEEQAAELVERLASAQFCQSSADMSEEELPRVQQENRAIVCVEVSPTEPSNGAKSKCE